ncbi:6-cysteine protein [Plasmodium brasilianum]|uniref:6-cysteine protein, putative n=2 Tax=Plasmodium (Plasmodium) TaxID=418103 RepID=A0A1A8WY64_PLAMA|nr:6-cysteine protein, putative [Plasmodium malariae]KAI4840630.1 6-cysteine protein [Plasmodium brasilianum]SBS96333.1 6-cysteine protein, putative [Plasmodium malariae]SBT86194.1 6-cysteine protein, putative [Plasmodium malariae]
MNFTLVSITSLLVSILHLVKNVFSLYERNGIPLCYSEFYEDKECLVGIDFGKGVNLYCPTDTLDNENNGVARFDNLDINNLNKCFNQMKKGTNNEDRNDLKSIQTLVPDILINKSNKGSTYNMYIPHTIQETFIASCYCIDRGRQKAHKMNIQFSKNSKNQVKGCNFYFSENERKKYNSNSLEKNVNLKYENNCDINGEAEDIISFKCTAIDQNNNVIVLPSLCFHTVLTDNNEETQIEGLVNGVKVIPKPFFYHNDIITKNFLSYIFLPSRIQDNTKVKCVCTIADQVSANVYAGTLSLSLIKNFNLYPINSANNETTNEKILTDHRNNQAQKGSSKIGQYSSFLFFILVLASI